MAKAAKLRGLFTSLNYKNRTPRVGISRVDVSVQVAG